MKAHPNRLNKQPQSTTTNTPKTKILPGCKENASISSKYLSLLKRKTELIRGSPKTETSSWRLITNIEPKDVQDFSKVLIESRKDNSVSSKLKMNNKKDVLVFSTGHNALNGQNHTFNRSEVNYNNNQDNAIYKAFRSPPVSTKLTPQTHMMSTFNSTGKGRTKSPIGRSSNLGVMNAVEKKGDSVRNSRVESVGVSSILSQESNYIIINESIKVNNKCANHPDKKSKYYVKDDQISLNSSEQAILPAFCSNCTFNLVKNGFTCEEIIATGEQFKKEKLAVFLEKLQKEKENCEFVIRALDNKSDGFKHTLGAEISKIDSYFDGLIENLNMQKNVIADKLISTFGNSTHDITEFKSIFADFYNEFETIQQDIDATYTKIIKNSEIEPFNEILGNYKERLNEFKETNNQLENLKLYNGKVDFEVQPELLKPKLTIKYDITTETSKIIDAKLINLCLTANSKPNPQHLNIQMPDSITDLPLEEDPNTAQNTIEDSFRKSAFSKSDVNVSFDKDYPVELLHSREEYNRGRRSSKGMDSERYTEKLSSALDRINNSQSVRNNQYLKLIGLMKKPDKQLMVHEKENVSSGISEIEEHNIFEIEGVDFKELLNKQTPDLGLKSEQPEYLKDYFQALTNNMNNNDIRMNIEMNLVNKDDGKDQFKSQKVLFQ